MDKIHHQLIKNHDAYKSWHESPHATLAHWAIFLLFAVFASSSLLTNIDYLARENSYASVIFSTNRKAVENSGPKVITINFSEQASANDIIAIMEKYNLTLLAQSGTNETIAEIPAGEDVFRILAELSMEDGLIDATTVSEE